MSGVPAEHDELRRRMARFLPLMDSTDDSSGVLLRERVEFSRLFASHVAQDQRAVAARVAAEPGFAATASDYRGQLERLRAAYSAHIARWTPATIRDDRSGYRAAVVTLQRRFHELMAWEERHLH